VRANHQPGGHHETEATKSQGLDFIRPGGRWAALHRNGFAFLRRPDR
jgi:hypothetical protein